MNENSYKKNVLEPYKNDVIDMYVNQGKGLKTIAKKYGVSPTTVRLLLNKNGIETRKTQNKPYNLNENFFDNIDTEEKAYILGFWYADGANCIEYNRTHLTLQEDDKEILDKMKEIMEIEKPLQYYNKSKKNPNWKNTYTLVIYSKHVCQKLKELGCGPRKTFVLEFPDFKLISKDLIYHFIRGYFDGDGSISRPIDTGCHISFTSSYNFCKGLENFLKEDLNLECKTILHKNGKNGILMITKMSEVKKLCEKMYENASIYLERKYSKYINKFYKIKKENID